MTIPSPSFACLAIETATELPSVAVVRGDALVLRESPGLRAPSRSVFEWVRELLDESATALDDLDCIAFGCGPGSFTGVRVAVALAQGLGYASGLPLCPVSTLATLAAGALRESDAEVVACCLDAHMGEVYVGMYRRDARHGVLPIVPDMLEVPAHVVLPGEGPLLAAGPGWMQYPELTERLGSRFAAVEAGRLPSAADLARLALPRFRAGQLVAAAEAHPNYLRHRVAIAPKVTCVGSTN